MADHNENLTGQSVSFNPASVVSHEISLLLIGLSLACGQGSVSLPDNVHAPAGQTVTLGQGSVSVTGSSVDDSVNINTPERTNLLLQSQAFNTTWATSAAVVTANSNVAPDGTTTADKLYETVVNSTHFLYQSFNLVSGTVYTLSVYAKMDGNRYLILGGLGATVDRSFDLQTGLVGTYSTGSSTYVIETIGDYYRISLTWTQGTTTSGDIRFFTSNVDALTAYAGDGSSGVILWGAQLEVSNQVTGYIPTTTATVTVEGNVIGQGSLTETFTGTHSPSGQALTLAQGSISVAFEVQNISLSGQALTLDQAAVVTQEVLLHLIGQSLTLSQGSVATSDGTVVSLTGQALTLGQGAIVFTAVDVNLTGQTLSLNFTNEMDFSLDQGLTGQLLTLTQDAISLPGDTPVSIPGLDLTLGQGVLVETLDWSLSLSGQALILSQGALVVSVGQDDVANLEGFSLTLGQGSLALDNNVYLSGLLVTLNQGVVTALSTTIFAELVGQSLNVNIDEMCPVSIFDHETITSPTYVGERCV